MKNEIKVIACLLLMLMVLEFGARLFETRLSKDVQHLRELPQQAEHIREAPNSALKVLVLGNSLARCGIDVAVLSTGLREHTKREVVVAEMHPDGSRIEEWTYGYRRYFQASGAMPDVVLLTTGKLHLCDQMRSINGMGAFYVGSGDVWEFGLNRLSGIDETAVFLTARISTLFAHRARVQPLVMYNLVPGYAETAQEINRGMSVDRGAVSMPERSISCDVFKHFVTGLRNQGTRLLVVSVPMPETYELPPLVRQTVMQGGAGLLEFGSTMKMAPARFPDDYHLDAEGAILLTKDIVAEWDHVVASGKN